MDLVVKTADGKTTRTEDATAVDLDLLREFLDGKDKHDGGQRGESAMKDQLPRIRKLLGVEEPARQK